LILDASAIVAILFREADREELLSKIDAARMVGVGAPTLVETAIVLDARLGDAGRHDLKGFLANAGVVVVSFDDGHWEIAVEAWLRYGRGRHKASLNFGDCLAYATARVADRPLLCKGDDFAKTDIALA
jgi:ribonuclease VapC